MEGKILRYTKTVNCANFVYNKEKELIEKEIVTKYIPVECNSNISSINLKGTDLGLFIPFGFIESDNCKEISTIEGKNDDFYLEENEQPLLFVSFKTKSISILNKITEDKFLYFVLKDY